MYKYIVCAAAALLCMTKPLLAQGGYNFLQRDNPFGLQSNQSQGPGISAFCWAGAKRPRKAYITTIFQPYTYTREEIESSLTRNAGPRFTCSLGRSPELNQFATRKTAELATQADVERLNVSLKPR
jgi:hypothetical protein